MDILEYIKQMQEMYGDQASLADDLEPGALKDELLKDFDPSQETYEEYLQRKSLERPFNMAQGGSAGQLVTPSVDGSRPGYGGVDYTDEANKIVNDYKKHIAKDFSMKGDLRKAPALDKYLQNRFGKNYKNVSYKINKFTNFDSRGYLQEQKLNLADGVVNKLNNKLKFFEEGKNAILKLVGGEGARTGQSPYTKKLYKILNKLDSREDKVTKALGEIVNNNLPLKGSTKVSAAMQKQGALRSMIGEMTGVSSNALEFKSGLKKGYKQFAGKFDVSPKEFEDTWKYLNRTGKMYDNLKNVPFDQAFKFAAERVKGAAELGGSDLLSFYRDPNSNIVNYIFRHWDRNNFSGTNSRVKLYDRNKVKLVDGNLVPKKGYKLKDIELKWKSGKKFNIRDIAFSYDGSELFDGTTIRTKGRESGLFDDVYKATKDYYTLYNRPVPDPKNIGKTIKFGEMMTRDYGKNSLAIGHNALGGVKAEPVSNFQIQTQKMNTAIYQATKNIKNKDLQKRVLREIYGDLYNLKGDKYIEAFIKNPPNIGYKEAAKNIIEGSPEWTKGSSKKQAELFKIAGFNTADFMKNRRILIEKAKANAALKTARKGGFLKQVQKICRLAKSSGGRIGFFNGGMGDDTCPLIESDPKRFLNEIVQVDKGVVGKFFKTPQAVKFAKQIAKSTLSVANPTTWIGGEAFYVGLEGMNSHSKGVPWNEALDDAFIFYDFEKVNKNIEDTASKMNLDESSMALLKNTMNINRLDSDMGKVQSQLKMVESDPLSEADVSLSYDRINEIQGQLDNEIQSYVSNVGELFNQDPATLSQENLYKGFDILSNVFRKKVLTERQDKYKDIATRADPLAGNLGNWLNTNLFNLDVWKPQYLFTTKLTPEQEEQKYLNEIGNKFIPGTKIPNPKYNPRELYLYNRDARNLTYDSPLVDEALALRTESQPVLGTGWYSNTDYASGGRAGYMGGGITEIRKPSAIPPESGPQSQGLASLKKYGSYY